MINFSSVYFIPPTEHLFFELQHDPENGIGGISLKNLITTKDVLDKYAFFEKLDNDDSNEEIKKLIQNQETQEVFSKYGLFDYGVEVGSFLLWVSYMAQFVEETNYDTKEWGRFFRSQGSDLEIIDAMESIFSKDKIDLIKIYHKGKTEPYILGDYLVNALTELIHDIIWDGHKIILGTSIAKKKSTHSVVISIYNYLMPLCSPHILKADMYSFIADYLWTFGYRFPDIKGQLSEYFDRSWHKEAVRSIINNHKKNKPNFS